MVVEPTTARRQFVIVSMAVELYSYELTSDYAYALMMVVVPVTTTGQEAPMAVRFFRRSPKHALCPVHRVGLWFAEEGSSGEDSLRYDR